MIVAGMSRGGSVERVDETEGAWLCVYLRARLAERRRSIGLDLDSKNRTIRAAQIQNTQYRRNSSASNQLLCER